MRVLDYINLTAPGSTAGRGGAAAPGAVVGNHSIWLPHEGVKLPFQSGGRIRKYSRPNEPSYDLGTLAHEVAILRALGALQMAPPIGDWIYAKLLISTHTGAWHADPLGAYGYEMADAERLPPGKFDVAAMRALPIDGSEGAWSDITVPGRANVVNGYLVDVRRTAWDMLRWAGPDLPVLPVYREDPAVAEALVRRDCQFPHGERPEPYQDFYLGGRWVRGARRVEARAVAMGFSPAPDESVLDIGCQSGGFLQWSHLRQADALAGAVGRHAGIDIEPDYIECAQRLARLAGHDICYRQADVTDPLARAGLIAWTRDFAPRGLDHLLLLSMDKHIGEPVLWDLVDQIGARHTYLETNAQRDGVYALAAGVEARGGLYVGDSSDRNTRRLYRIDRGR